MKNFNTNIKSSIKYISLTLGAFLMSSALSASTYYVVSPAAKLLGQPRSSGPVLQKKIKRGTAVKQVGKQGLYLKVRMGSKTGWISKLYVSKFKPRGKIKVSKGLKKSKSVNIRRRASSFSETAAARGHKKSETLRTRGSAHMYDFAGVKWLEEQETTDKDLDTFLKDGNLTGGQ